MSADALRGTLLALCVAGLPASAIAAQQPTPDGALSHELEAAVWRSIQPALPFPAAADDDTPVNGDDGARWLVRRSDGDEPGVAEVVANPLNEENQRRAEQAMAAIREAVTEAERRAQSDYDRIISGRAPREEMLNGVSLDDEGASGERADWDARLTIDAHAVQHPFEVELPGPDAPVAEAVDGGVVLSVNAAEYEDPADARRHFRPAEAHLFFGVEAAPASAGARGRSLIKVAAPTLAHAVQVTIRGNADLLREVLAKSNWRGVVAAITPK